MKLGRRIASPTTPLPFIASSSCARRSELTVFPGSRSAGRMTPRIKMICRSELIIVSLCPSMTRYPFGRTLVTRADSVVVSTVWRLVAPCPCRDDAVERLARFASTPAAALGPSSDAILLFRLDCRAAVAAPVLDPSAFSVTEIVTRSSTRLARRSLARSESSADVLHSEPGDAAVPPPPDAMWRRRHTGRPPRAPRPS